MRATVTDHEAHAQARPHRHHSGVEFCCTRGRKPVQRMLALHMTAASDNATTLRYRLAADQGDVVAQFNLGAMYDNGHGAPQDNAEALKWSRKAADQGNAGAQTSLGALYYKGQGVPRTYAEAMKWFRLAADQGDAQAQFNLGVMYEDGQGVPQD
jgi:TPR repeat protein